LTVVEGLEQLSAFVGCAAGTFSRLFGNAFRSVIDYPRGEFGTDGGLCVVHGILALCTMERENGCCRIELDRLPPEGLLQMTDRTQVGLFRISGDRRVSFADDAFYRLAGCDRKTCSDRYGNDLTRLFGTESRRLFSGEPVRSPFPGGRSLVFCGGTHAGYCFPVSRYPAILARNGFVVWEYDYAGHRVVGRTLCREDEKALENLHRKLEDGELTCQATLPLFLGGTATRWYHVRYIREKARAQALAQDLSLLSEHQRYSFLANQFDMDKPRDLVSTVKADLRSDALLEAEEYGLAIGRLPKPARYSDWVAKTLSAILDENDRNGYRHRFCLEALRKAAFEGIRSVSMEYRCHDSFGVIRWVEKRVFLSVDRDTETPYAVDMTRYITEKKRVELALAEKPTRDDASGFYDCTTTAMMVSRALQDRSDPGSLYTLAVIDIPGLEDIGSVSAKALVSEFSQVLRFGLYERCLVGRYDLSRFVVFLPHVDTVAEVRGLFEKLSGMLSNAYLFVPVSHEFWSNIGFAMARYEEGVPYDRLLDFAFLALENAHEIGRNQVVARHAVSDADFADTRSSFLERLYGEGRRELSENADTDLDPGPYGSALSRILSRLGTCYQASRICLVAVDRHGKPQIPASWERCSSEQAFADLGHDPFRSLGDHFDVVGMDGDDPRIANTCFSGSDLLIGCLEIWDVDRGYLVVAGPNEKDPLFLEHALQSVSSEMTKQRLLEQQRYLLYHDPMTGLRNFNGYNRFVSTLQEDVFSSLGVVLLDIDNLSGINARHGKEYGNTLIEAVAERMQLVFPENQLFRLAGDEFLVIAADLTYKSFNDRVGVLARHLRQRYPDSISFGQAWSDSDRHVSVLYNQESMLLEARRHKMLEENPDEVAYSIAVHELEKAIGHGEYVVYLQPKVSVSDAVLCGAEALVRRFDPELGIVSPSHFIPDLEKSGLVRYIDLFVFGQVCGLLQSWVEAGIPPVPVSLNFSRATLLDEQLVSSLTEITDRCGIDRGLVEIEITESFGALDRNLVRTVVQGIHDEGFCICIDDFGSEYSNLSTLTSLPLGILKLDKSLVDNLCTSSNNQVFVDGFVSICRKLGIRTVAEGVENELQKEMVSAMGCDMIQGYYYDKPLSVDSFEQKYMMGK
jgi:EAL domain-containing protein (putative c-di-GMP-specific phosphodiesterase class I)/GGDEF domain-containing protein